MIKSIMNKIFLPKGELHTGNNFIKSVCPECKPGEGYSQDVIYKCWHEDKVSCGNCGTKFKALVS